MTGLIERFEEMPSNDDLYQSMEWTDDPEMADHSRARVPDERFIHPRTGTQVDIYGEEGPDIDGTVYSVQPKMGGYDHDAIVQPDDPNQLVSHTASVLCTEAENLPTARVVAFMWLRGWMARNTHIDSILDLERQ